MKIFSSEQIREWDAYTMHARNISSQELMERAADACARYIFKHYSADIPFVVLCGMGNNGGDGLALARMLMQSGYGVKIFVLQHREQPSADNRANANKLLRINASLIDYVSPDTYLADLPEHVVLIDAILGTGLNKPVEGWLGAFINHVNQFPNRKIAIDIPSGLPADHVPPTDAPVLHADETLTFQTMKRSFLHAETGVHCGEVTVLDIGLHPSFAEATHTHYNIIDETWVSSLRKRRDAFSYKNTHGHAFLAAGSYGKAGAAVLSTTAALRSGAGLVTAIVPELCYDIVQISAPEAMCQAAGGKYLDAISHYDAATAIGVGPGIDTKEDTSRALSAFLDNCNLPCVFDADALNIMSRHKELLSKIPANSILTPHPGECRRLFGEQNDSMQQVEHIRLQAMRYNICILLKGHHTVIVTPEGDCYYNMTGNAGMAKGGSGDVLTGLLTGLLAQGYDATEAAVLGVYLHGKAGDLALSDIAMEAMKAGDLVHYLNAAWQTLGKI